MGRHLLNYRVTRRRRRSPVFVIAAVIANAALLLAMVVIVARLLFVFVWAPTGSLEHSPWMILVILVGTLTACLWGGVSVVRDIYRALRGEREDVDLAESKGDDGNNGAG